MRNRLDELVARLQGLSPLFPDGWGNERHIEELLEALEDPGALPEIAVHTFRESDWFGTRKLDVYFQSPAIRLGLPAETATAYARVLLPPSDEPPPVCVHLAGTGDTTYTYRTYLARPLLRKGIGAVLLQNPYYGSRKPQGQTLFSPRTVVDQLRMNFATVQETRGLLNWLRRQGHEYLGVTGYSMGGFTASYAAALTPFPIAAIPCASGFNPAAAFTRGPLETVIAWEALTDEPMTEEDARARLDSLLSSLSLERFPVPAEPEAAIILAGQHDALVPPESAEELHEHWTGSQLRWMPGGHITGYSVYAGRIREAIHDAFAMLVASGPDTPESGAGGEP